jgi:hypothetical protein
MQSFVKTHFLSAKDNLRFLLFVVAAFLLIGISAFNRNRPLQFLPAQNQIIDSKPKQSSLPKIQKFQDSKEGKERT